MRVNMRVHSGLVLELHSLTCKHGVYCSAFYGAFFPLRLTHPHTYRGAGLSGRSDALWQNGAFHPAAKVRGGEAP